MSALPVLPPTDPAPPAAEAGPAFSPLYQQIKDLITRGLQAGEWKPGEAIPSETDLAARFRVSQGTVRKAIDELATENLLVRRQGKGTFVATHAEEQIQYRFLRLRPGNHQQPCAQSGTESHGKSKRPGTAHVGILNAKSFTGHRLLVRSLPNCTCPSMNRMFMPPGA